MTSGHKIHISIVLGVREGDNVIPMNSQFNRLARALDERIKTALAIKAAMLLIFQLLRLHLRAWLVSPVLWRGFSFIFLRFGFKPQIAALQNAVNDEGVTFAARAECFKHPDISIERVIRYFGISHAVHSFLVNGLVRAGSLRNQVIGSPYSTTFATANLHKNAIKTGILAILLLCQNSLVTITRAAERAGQPVARSESHGLSQDN